MAQLDPKKLSYLTFEEATREPGDGLWDIIVDRWWSYEDGKGLLFYNKSPQCNKVKSISEMVTRQCHPDAQVIFIHRVYMRHNCSDYI